MKKIFSLIALVIFFQPLKAQDTTMIKETIDINFAVGADVSFLKMAEDSGTVFKINGVAKPALQILKNHGYNWIRLRLFHSPDRLPNDLQYTIELAQQAKNLEFNFLLDYHYLTHGQIRANKLFLKHGKDFRLKNWLIRFTNILKEPLSLFAKPG